MGYVPLKVLSKKHVHALVGFLLVWGEDKDNPLLEVTYELFCQKLKKRKKKKKREREVPHPAYMRYSLGARALTSKATREGLLVRKTSSLEADDQSKSVPKLMRNRPYKVGTISAA